MTRFLGAASLVLAAILFTGCSGDRYEAPIRNVLSALKASEQNLNSIQKGLEEAMVKKTEYDKATDNKDEVEKSLKVKLGEVLNSIDDLKKQTEILRKEMLEGEKNPAAKTEKEKKDLARRYQGEMATLVKDIRKADVELQRTLERALVALKDLKSFKEVEQKYREADSEFKNLSGSLR